MPPPSNSDARAPAEGAAASAHEIYIYIYIVRERARQEIGALLRPSVLQDLARVRFLSGYLARSGWGAGVVILATRGCRSVLAPTLKREKALDARARRFRFVGCGQGGEMGNVPQNHRRSPETADLGTPPLHDNSVSGGKHAQKRLADGLENSARSGTDTAADSRRCSSANHRRAPAARATPSLRTACSPRARPELRLIRGGLFPEFAWSSKATASRAGHPSPGMVAGARTPGTPTKPSPFPWKPPQQPAGRGRAAFLPPGGATSRTSEPSARGDLAWCSSRVVLRVRRLSAGDGRLPVETL